MSESVWCLNTLSGVVDKIPDYLFNHPTFSQYHVEVEPGTKSYEPEKYKPQTADEYRASHAKKSEDKDKK